MRWRTAHRRAARQRRKAVLVAKIASRFYRVLVDGQRRRGGRLSREDAYDDVMALFDFDPLPVVHLRFTIPADFQDQIAAIMNVPARYLFNREDPINPQRYRKD